jgi:hypothetical protein
MRETAGGEPAKYDKMPHAVTYRRGLGYAVNVEDFEEGTGHCLRRAEVRHNCGRWLAKVCAGRLPVDNGMGCTIQSSGWC